MRGWERGGGYDEREVRVMCSDAVKGGKSERVKGEGSAGVSEKGGRGE